MAFGGYGVQGMLKDGHKLLSGLDEAVLKNIEACKQLSKITRSSLGPNGALTPATTPISQFSKAMKVLTKAGADSS